MKNAAGCLQLVLHTARPVRRLYWPEMSVSCFRRFGRRSTGTTRSTAKNAGQMRKTAKKAGVRRKRTVLKKTQKSQRFFQKPKKAKEKEKAKEKAKEKEKNSSFSCSAAVDLEPPRDSRRPATESDFSAYSFSPALQSKLASWFAYKQERRQPYTPQQKQALLQTVAQKLSSYPESAIISLVDQCMVAGWKNIIFERLDKPGAVPQSAGFNHSADPDFQAAIRRMAGGDPL